MSNHNLKLFPFWLGIFLLSTSTLLPSASAYLAASQCVQVGHANSNLCSVTLYNTSIRVGPYTIGALKFDTKYVFLDFGYWGISNVQNSNKPCDPSSPAGYQIDAPAYTYMHACVPDSIVQLDIHAVKQDQQVMAGWLHVSIKLKDPNDEILAIYVQMRDEYFNAIGEFLTNEHEQCDADDKELAQPSKFQVLPCSAVGLREARVSTALFMVQPDALRIPAAGEKYLSKVSIKRGVHFTWRMSEYWCNRKLRIRPDAIILTKKATFKTFKNGTASPDYNWFFKHLQPYIYRVIPPYWIHHDFYGAADIKLPHTKFNCDEDVMDFKTGKMLRDSNGSLVAPWLLDKTTRCVLYNDYFDPREFDEAKKEGGWFKEKAGDPTLLGCLVNPRKNYVNPDPTQIPGNVICKKNASDTVTSFGGRCMSHYKKEVSHDTPQGCNLDATSEEYKPVLAKYGQNMTTYSNFINVLTINRTRLCQVECKVPTAANISDILKFTDTSGETKFSIITKVYTASRVESRVEKFNLGRKYHGLLCVYWTVFLLPISLFCARYMKETCMRVDCMGAHFWFWIHIGTSLLSLAMFVSSLTALWLYTSIWGRSLHPSGKLHRVLGYMSATLFFLMITLGCFRAIHVRRRLVVMTIHSILGFLIYIFNLLAMLSSAFIPASPSMLDCDAEGNATGVSTVFWLTVFWIVLDISVHVVMTLIQFMKDKEVGLERFWLCPVVPILKYDSADDFIGAGLRKLTLMIYAAAAFVIANAMAGLVQSNRLSMECQMRMGPLSCEDIWGCSTAGQKISKRFANLVNISGVYGGNVSLP